MISYKIITLSLIISGYIFHTDKLFAQVKIHELPQKSSIESTSAPSTSKISHKNPSHRQTQSNLESSTILSLSECINYAVANSYKTNTQKTRTEDEAIAYNQAIMNFLPAVSASTALESSFGRGIDPETNSYINENSLSNSLRLNGGLTLFGGLKTLNTSRRAKISKLRGEDELEMVKDEVALETMAAFAEVIYFQELIDLYEKKLAQYSLEETKMARMVELGAGSLADLAQVRAQKSKEKYASITAMNNYEISLIKLKDCMNFPLEGSLVISNSFGEANPIESMIQDSGSNNPILNAEKVIENAFSHNPQARIFSHNLAVEELSLSIAKGGYYPTLELYGGISTAFFRHLNNNSFTSYGKQLSNNLGEWVGVSLSIPIFDKNYRRNTVRKAKNSLDRAKLDYAQNLRTLESEIRKAIMELNASKSAWVEAGHNVEYQTLANQAIREKYEKGVSSIIEVQTSDANLFSAEVELRNSYLKYQLMLREVNYYNGVPLYSGSISE